eukprot:8883873-Pyramimonas_sp.AAC.1
MGLAREQWICIDLVAQWGPLGADGRGWTGEGGGQRVRGSTRWTLFALFGGFLVVADGLPSTC